MSRSASLISTARASIRELTVEQKRFRYLIGQIETVRASRFAWEKTIGKFRVEHLQRLQPLRASLREQGRATVVAIDRLLDDSGWSRVDRVALREMLCATADALLAAEPDDAELRAFFEKHREASFDAVQQEQMQRLREEAEEVTGLDLGDDTGLRTEEDLVQRMYEKMAEREAAEAEHESARSGRRREHAAGRRVEAAAQLVRQSLREIYRRLASAVHPDRESDPRRREEKNALMQRINQAYSSGDLLALFEVQIEIGLEDQIGNVSSPRLKQYNKLLAQQLGEAKSSLEKLQAAFRMDFGLDSYGDLTPQKLNLVIQRQARAIRAEIARQKEFLSVLSNKTTARRWLKERRRFDL